jgi:hypothetical protein
MRWLKRAVLSAAAGTTSKSVWPASLMWKRIAGWSGDVVRAASTTCCPFTTSTSPGSTMKSKGAGGAKSVRKLMMRQAAPARVVGMVVKPSTATTTSARARREARRRGVTSTTGRTSTVAKRVATSPNPASTRARLHVGRAAPMVSRTSWRALRRRSCSCGTCRPTWRATWSSLLWARMPMRRRSAGTARRPLAMPIAARVARASTVRAVVSRWKTASTASATSTMAVTTVSARSAPVARATFSSRVRTARRRAMIAL